MMIAGFFALWLVFQTCGKNFHSWKENSRQIAAFQLVNLIKKNNIRALYTHRSSFSGYCPLNEIIIFFSHKKRNHNHTEYDDNLSITNFRSCHLAPLRRLARHKSTTRRWQDVLVRLHILRMRTERGFQT